MVLNVRGFKSEHPGGAFLLDFHIGRDVSKFFYGGYVLENNSGMKPYTHSNVARSIVNSLIIGKLRKPAEIYDAKIVKATKVNSTTKVFTFKLEGQNARFITPSSTDYFSFGMHYLLKSHGMPKVRRHYTISSCMREETYKEYLNAIQLFKSGQSVNFN